MNTGSVTIDFHHHHWLVRVRCAICGDINDFIDDFYSGMDREDGLLGLLVLVLVLLDNFNNEVMDQILPENRDGVSDSDSGTERGDRDTVFCRFCCQLFFIICYVDF